MLAFSGAVFFYRYLSLGLTSVGFLEIGLITVFISPGYQLITGQNAKLAPVYLYD